MIQAFLFQPIFLNFISIVYSSTFAKPALSRTKKEDKEQKEEKREGKKEDTEGGKRRLIANKRRLRLGKRRQRGKQEDVKELLNHTHWAHADSILRQKIKL